MIFYLGVSMRNQSYECKVVEIDGAKVSVKVYPTHGKPKALVGVRVRVRAKACKTNDFYLVDGGWTRRFPKVNG